MSAALAIELREFSAAGRANEAVEGIGVTASNEQGYRRCSSSSFNPLHAIRT